MHKDKWECFLGATNNVCAGKPHINVDFDDVMFAGQRDCGLGLGAERKEEISVKCKLSRLPFALFDEIAGPREQPA